MRVTTNMVNDAAKRAGLPILNQSLLDNLNGSKATQGADDQTLLKALSKNDTGISGKMSKTYEELGKSAKGLEDCLEKLTGSKGEDMLEKARASGSKEELYRTVKELAQYYNDTMDRLSKTSSKLDRFYREGMADVINENKDLLESVGISLSADGHLSVDESKFKGADVERLEQVFGSGKEWKDKLLFLADRVSNNAAIYQESLVNQYGMDGNSFAAYTNSRFDYLG